jgi:hypothetical protein
MNTPILENKKARPVRNKTGFLDSQIKKPALGRLQLQLSLIVLLYHNVPDFAIS